MTENIIQSKNPIDKRFAKVTRYHYYFFSLYFFSRFPSIWHVLNLIFLEPPMNYTCGSGTSKASRTHRTNGIRSNALGLNVCPCSDPVWDRSVFTKTVQTKFGIYCEKKWLIGFGQSFSVLGSVIGSFAFGYMSDKFGRLPSFSLSCLLVAISGCLIGMMPSMAMYIVMRFFEGFGHGGLTVNGYVLCIEYCGIQYRETISAILHIPNNLGHIAIAGVSYILRDCDHFQIAISVPMLIPAASWFLMLESPKWLLDNNHREKAIIVMEKFCKFNKGPNCKAIKAEIEAYQPLNTSKVETMKFHQIFKYRRLTINLACMSYLFFICGLGYYGVSQFIGKMSGDIHINTAVGGSFLVPGTVACMFMLNKLKRKTFLVLTNVTSGSLILCAMLIPKHFEPAWIRVLLAGIANSFFYMSFTIIFLYSVELFPTSARNSALGFLTVISRVGQMTAPQINTLPQSVSGFIFGILAVLGAVVAIPLPETKNTELPSTVEDIQRVSQRTTTRTENSSEPKSS